MPQQYVNPSKQILLSPPDARTREYEVGAAATAAKMLPGTFVIYDTVGRCVKESGAEAHSYIGILEARTDKGLHDAYARGDQCTVIVGECECLARFPAGEDIDVGDRLKIGADGLCVELTTGNLGEQGATVGYALEDSGGALGAECLLLIHFLPAVEAQTAA